MSFSREVVLVTPEKRVAGINFCGKRATNSVRYALKLSCGHTVYLNGYDHGGAYAAKNKKRIECDWCRYGEEPQE